MKDAGALESGRPSASGRWATSGARSRSVRSARGVLGGGKTGEYPVIRHMNNLESVLAYEGTHEVHTLVVGGALTGTPAWGQRGCPSQRSPGRRPRRGAAATLRAAILDGEFPAGSARQPGGVGRARAGEPDPGAGGAAGAGRRGQRGLAAAPRLRRHRARPRRAEEVLPPQATARDGRAPAPASSARRRPSVPRARACAEGLRRCGHRRRSPASSRPTGASTTGSTPWPAAVGSAALDVLWDSTEAYAALYYVLPGAAAGPTAPIGRSWEP